MVTLTINQFLAPEHLDMLWAVTEKVRQQQQRCWAAVMHCEVWLRLLAENTGSDYWIRLLDQNTGS
jgi:hypothetical protein